MQLFSSQFTSALASLAPAPGLAWWRLPSACLPVRGLTSQKRCPHSDAEPCSSPSFAQPHGDCLESITKMGMAHSTKSKTTGHWKYLLLCSILVIQISFNRFRKTVIQLFCGFSQWEPTTNEGSLERQSHDHWPTLPLSHEHKEGATGKDSLPVYEGLRLPAGFAAQLRASKTHWSLNRPALSTSHPKSSIPYLSTVLK